MNELTESPGENLNEISLKIRQTLIQKNGSIDALLDEKNSGLLAKLFPSELQREASNQYFDAVDPVRCAEAVDDMTAFVGHADVLFKVVCIAVEWQVACQYQGEDEKEDCGCFHVVKKRFH